MIPAIFGISGLALSAEERAFFVDADPAGYILFGRNVQDRSQLLALTAELRAIHGRERLLITIDQEGGRVARMRPPTWQAWPSGSVFDALYEVAPASAIEAARCNAEALGLDLAEVGISCTHAPVLDVRQPGAHDVIGDRAYGSEPLRVAALGRAVLDGLARAGVAGTIKHIPGHGRACADSHKELPTVDATAEELEVDIAPFRALSDAAMGMTAHVRYLAWDSENPGTLSPYVVGEIIRKRIGFGGLLMTDDIDMQALTGPVPENAAKALAAGCDIALNCWAKVDDMVGIAKACPSIRDDSFERLERALAPTDVPQALPERQRELLAKRDALLALVSQAA